jgi:hypothetical protein
LARINCCGPTPYRPAMAPRDSPGWTTCHSVSARTVGGARSGSGVGVTGGDPGNGVGGSSRVRRSGVGSGEGDRGAGHPTDPRRDHLQHRWLRLNRRSPEARAATASAPPAARRINDVTLRPSLPSHRQSPGTPGDVSSGSLGSPTCGQYRSASIRGRSRTILPRRPEGVAVGR